MSTPSNVLSVKTGAIAVLILTVLLVLQLIPMLLTWRTSSVLDRILDLCLAAGLGLIALDTLQRKLSVSQDALKVRYLFFWKTYPLPKKFEVQDWGHSVGFVDPVTFRTVFILPKHSFGGGRVLQDLRAVDAKKNS